MADKPFIARGFHSRRQAAPPGRLPPGQYETRDFTIRDSDGRSVRWSWEEFQALPRDTPTVDIHCVTKWSKFDTTWEGVSVDTLLDAARAGGVTEGPFVVAFCDGGYTTDLPLADVTGGKAWVAFGYNGAPLPPEHGGPARLLVPHLYFWKSAKWVRGLQLIPREEPGFWEQLGYHDRGDPW